MNLSKSSVTFEDANVIQQVKNELQTIYSVSLSVSAAATEFHGWSQNGIDAYMLHQKHHAKPHSFFNCFCYSHCSQKLLFLLILTKSFSMLPISDRPVKRVLESIKLAFANK